MNKLGARARTLLSNNALFVVTLVAIVIGFIIGFSIRSSHPSADALMWIGLPGDVFMRLLKMMIVPLIVCGVISGTASLDPKSNGKVSGVAFVYVVLTNIAGCVLGVVLTLIIKPGRISGGNTNAEQVESILKTQDIFADLIRNIFPDNIVNAAILQVRTAYIKTDRIILVNDSLSGLVNKTVTDEARTLVFSNGANILGLILCCTLFGVATSTNKEKGKPFLDFFASASDIVLIILRWCLWYAPIGIISLIAASIAAIQDLEATFSKLGLFVLCVTLGVIIHQLLLLPIVYLMITRKNPFLLFASVFRAWVIGFAATSTAVAIPEMMQACDEQKVDKRVSRFVIPFCVTLNADGSAIFITSAAIFLSQISGVQLDAGKIIVIGVVTAVSAMALPSVPSSSLVTLVIILTSLNLPTHHLALLFTAEWFLDRIRTTSNIVSHTFGAAITYRLCRASLDRLDNKYEDEEKELEIEVGLMEIQTQV